VLKLRLYGGGKMAVKLGVGRHLARRLTRILAVQSSGQNEVWSTDMTYLPMRGGFLYLVAVMAVALRSSTS
jgi:transposase InsO family protein